MLGRIMARIKPGEEESSAGPFVVSGGLMSCPCCTPSPVVVVDLTAVLTKLTHLEELVATAAEQITALSAKVDDIAADFSALVTALNAERENLTPAGQAALDAANAKI